MITERFFTCSWRFLRSNKLERLEFKLEKLLGFRNMQENLEKNVLIAFPRRKMEKEEREGAKL